MKNLWQAVVLAALAYTERFPRRTLIFQGSTVARTRLYRMVINKALKDLEKTFLIIGLEKWEDGMFHKVPFEAEGNYYAFLAKRRRIAELPNPPP